MNGLLYLYECRPLPYRHIIQQWIQFSSDFLPGQQPMIAIESENRLYFVNSGYYYNVLTRIWAIEKPVNQFILR